MCGGVTVYTALKRADYKQGDWAVVSGAGGGLGHLAIQYAKALGGRVIAIDSGNKEWLCRSVGADEFIDFAAFPESRDLTAKIKKMTKLGAAVALMCAADPRPYSQALRWLRVRGIMACIGVPASESALTPNLGEMVNRELRIFGKNPFVSMPIQCELTRGDARNQGWYLGRYAGMSGLGSDRQGEAILHH
jgi:alcohol dehydrogenase, propanol-preferring